MRNIYTFLFPAVVYMILLNSCSDSSFETRASGVFEATEIILSSEASGRILQLEKKEGDKVEAGQVLGHIDSVQLDLKRELILTGIKSLESKMPDVTIQTAPLVQEIDTANLEKKRFENLIAAGAANQKQLDDINAKIMVLEKQLRAQRVTLEDSRRGIGEEIKSMEIQISQVEDQLGKCLITSPIDGTVLVRYKEEGELALNGSSLLKIADLNHMYLRAYITSDQLTELKLGQSLEVISDFGEKEIRSYEGTLVWISDKAEFTPKTIQTRDERSNLVYAVKVAVFNDGYLKIGMYGGIKAQNE